MTSVSVRPRAALRLGTLAALLLCAGALPWITAGPLATRLIALPLLLTGALMAVATVRLRSTPLPRRRTAAERPAACVTCACACATSAECLAGSVHPGSGAGTMEG